MRHTISEAAQLTEKNRTTIHRHIKTGKLSKGIGLDGMPYVETSELIRCYGELQHPVGEKSDTLPHAENTPTNEELMIEIRELKAEVAALSNRIEHKPLLPGKPEPKPLPFPLNLIDAALDKFR